MGGRRDTRQEPGKGSGTGHQHPRRTREDDLLREGDLHDEVLCPEHHSPTRPEPGRSPVTPAGLCHVPPDAGLVAHSRTRCRHHGSSVLISDAAVGDASALSTLTAHRIRTDVRRAVRLPDVESLVQTIFPICGLLRCNMREYSRMTAHHISGRESFCGPRSG